MIAFFDWFSFLLKQAFSFYYASNLYSLLNFKKIKFSYIAFSLKFLLFVLLSTWTCHFLSQMFSCFCSLIIKQIEFYLENYRHISNEGSYFSGMKSCNEWAERKERNSIEWLSCRPSFAIDWGRFLFLWMNCKTGLCNAFVLQGYCWHQQEGQNWTSSNVNVMATRINGKVVSPPGYLTAGQKSQFLAFYWQGRSENLTRIPYPPEL